MSPGSPNGYRYMSMAGALGDRWAIRTHPSCVAAGDAAATDAADAAGGAAAARTAAPPSKAVIAASLAICLNNLMIGYLSACSRPAQRKRASDHGRACSRALPVNLEGRRQQSERARRGE